MPALVSWLISALETKAGTLVLQVLVSLGLSFTTYKFSVAPLRDFIAQQVGGMSAQFVNILGFLGVDQAITMILSAIAARYAVQGAKVALSKKVSA